MLENFYYLKLTDSKPFLDKDKQLVILSLYLGNQYPECQSENMYTRVKLFLPHDFSSDQDNIDLIGFVLFCIYYFIKY